jgi:hypothetical protein
LGLVGENEAVEDALDEVLVPGGELRDRFELQPEAVVGSALVLVEDDVVASVPRSPTPLPRTPRFQSEGRQHATMLRGVDRQPHRCQVRRYEVD